MTTLMIHEWVTETGASESLHVGVVDGELVVHVEGTEVAMPMQVLERVMERYGKPLDPAVKLEGPELDMGDAGVLQRIRHRGFYDVIARDFIVWHPPGREPLAELATAISAALAHFARAAAVAT